MHRTWRTAAVIAAGIERDRAGPGLADDVAQPGGDLVHGVGHGDRLVRAVGLALHGVEEAVRVDDTFPTPGIIPSERAGATLTIGATMPHIYLPFTTIKH